MERRVVDSLTVISQMSGIEKAQRAHDHGRRNAADRQVPQPGVARMNSGIVVSSAMFLEKIGLLIVPASSSG